jgi:hypothetical protein
VVGKRQWHAEEQLEAADEVVVEQLDVSDESVHGEALGR